MHKYQFQEPQSALTWQVSEGLVGYEEAVAAMERRVTAIRDEGAAELVWLLEHPPLYTAGSSAQTEELKEARFPVYQTGRGGRHTYHGPGQRVAYVMLDLKKHYAAPDIRQYVQDLEEWVILTLAEWGVHGERREDRIGIWVVDKKGKEKKIAALGVRVRHWVSYHGIALNVAPDLEHYSGIVPCGIAEYGVTSLQALGVDVSVAEVDAALQRNFEKVFGAR